MELTTSNSLPWLFDSLPSFLPILTEGETLFSWAARYHRLSGNALARQSSIQLFGERRAGLRHDFPSHLDRFVAITQGQVGDAETLAYERTIFGFFAPFQDRDGANKVEAQMRGGSVEKVKSALGLLPSRLGGFFPLKACADCIREDLINYSVSRWHLEHQWPSVWICRKHRRMLQALRREFQSRDLRQWLLPEDVAIDAWSRFTIGSPVLKAKLLWIAELSSHTATLRGKHFDQQLLRYTYLLCGKERGWLFTDGSLNLVLVRQLFLDYYLGLENLPGFEIVQSVHAEHGGMLGLLMRQYDSRRHPMKHLLLIAFLFDSTNAFDRTYERIRQTHFNGGTDALEDLVGEIWKSELRRLIEIENQSLSNAAAAIGISLKVATRVAKQEKIAYQQRSRVINTVRGNEILAMIAEGFTRDEIFQKSGIKKTLLKDIMARDTALRNAWRRMDFERRKENYRSNFIALTVQLRGVPVKRLRLLPGNGVSWLYRNDREWLVSNLPCL